MKQSPPSESPAHGIILISFKICTGKLEIYKWVIYAFYSNFKNWCKGLALNSGIQAGGMTCWPLQNLITRLLC